MRYETAFNILHKIRLCTVRPDQDRVGARAGGYVEVDETYVGGRTHGERPGVRHKTLVTAVVEVSHREPGVVQAKRKGGCITDPLCGFVESTVMLGSLIVTNGWTGYSSLRTRGYNHHAIAKCGDPEVAG